MQTIQEPGDWTNPLTKWFDKLDQDILAGKVCEHPETEWETIISDDKGVKTYSVVEVCTTCGTQIGGLSE